MSELIDDLTGRFQADYEEGHAREKVEEYGHYFLGSIIISHKDGQNFIIDGQQRLTTLTLLLIYLHNLQKNPWGHATLESLRFEPSHRNRKAQPRRAGLYSLAPVVGFEPTTK